MGLKFQASHRGLVLLAPSPHPETIQGLTQGRLIRTKGSPVTQEMTTGSGVRRRIQSQRPIYFLLFHVCQHHLLNPLSFLHSFLFFFFLILFIYFWLHWVFVAARGLSPVVTSGGYSSLGCAGFSLRWLLLLRSTGSRYARFSSCGTRA